MVDFPNSPVLDQEFIANEVSYVWDGEKWVTGGVAGGENYLPLSGGTMTGYILHVPADPTDPQHTATKAYADGKILRTGDAMTGLLSLSNDPSLPLHAVPKRYMDSVVGALVSQLDLVGFYSAATGEIRWNADTAYSGDVMPSPGPDNKGFYLMCTVGGNVPPMPSTIEDHQAGDWLLSNGADAWVHIYISTRVEAAQVPVNPAVAGTDNVQAALEAMVPKSGAAMTGSLTLNADPTAQLHASTKQYADAGAMMKVSKAGDSMTGFLTLSGEPASPMHASNKSYTDARIMRSGDTMLGSLTLAADPVNPLHAVTKQYVDASASGGPPGGYLPVSGGIMTGPLTLASDPTNALHAASKHYVDLVAGTMMGPVPPVNPAPGTLWFDPAGLQLYIWYDDGNSAQWVVTINQIAAVTAIASLTRRLNDLEKKMH